MAFRTRLLNRKIRRLLAERAVILLTGPRQAGKTMLLKQLCVEVFGGKFETFAFDTPSEIDIFLRDPDLFWLNHPGILFLDEVQNVPAIFPYLKREVDQNPGQFRFFLSGSLHFPLMRGVSESLAGRAAILDLWPFAQREIHGDFQHDIPALIENPTRLRELVGQEFPVSDPRLFDAMLAGGYPPVCLKQVEQDWLESYRRTYLQRDIRPFSQNLGRFDRFLTLCAGRSGMILNKNELALTLGVDNKTIDHWLSVMEGNYQILILPAYSRNATKRLVKRPKLLFADSGLALHLQAIRDNMALENAPHFGFIFEAFVIMEICKLFGHAGLPFSGYYFRTSAGHECDLVLEAGGRPVPIEIKHAAGRSPNLKGLAKFREIYPQTDLSLVISLNPRVEFIESKTLNLPLGLILGAAIG